MISVNAVIPDLKIWEYNLIPSDAFPIGPVELSSKKEMDGKKLDYLVCQELLPLHVQQNICLVLLNFMKN